MAEDILGFIEDRIAHLTELRKRYEDERDNAMEDYASGAIDAYDIIRIKLGGE